MSGHQRCRAVAIRVDASPVIGLGHVMRCLTLANALTDQGFECVFVARFMIEDVKKKLAEAGHPLVMLPEDGPPPGPTPYGTWLGTTEEHDAEALGGHMKTLQPQIIVVDHYALGIAWERALRSSTDQPPLILALDDLSRSHDCDIVLDATLGKSANDYAHLVPAQCRVLTGPSHALLRPDFAAERRASLQRRDDAFAAGAGIQTILIFMGGADSADCTGWVLRGLCELQLPPEVELHVVTGPAYPHQDALRQFAGQCGRSVTLHHNVSDMAALLSRMDLVIGAAGSSSWERCCLGVPAINLILAENQKEAAQALSLSGASVDGGAYEPQNDPHRWAETKVGPLLKPAATHPISLAAREVTDGNGAARVVDVVLANVSHPLLEDAP
jgi:UDP-2,4-diacetamido-2,4,6-trideoxy-beta-L-altropyranose hydrolase